jgi:hypothetical protein
MSAVGRRLEIAPPAGRDIHASGARPSTCATTSAKSAAGNPTTAAAASTSSAGVPGTGVPASRNVVRSIVKKPEALAATSCVSCPPSSSPPT